MNKIWTETEKQFIRENSEKVKDAVIAETLTNVVGRKISVQSVRKQRQKMGIFKASGRGYCKLATPKAKVTPLTQ